MTTTNEEDLTNIPLNEQNLKEKLIAKRLNGFKADANLVEQAFKSERRTAKDYNGRQVLELLQNADDESASVLSFSLDKETKTLWVFNDGNPFTLKGIRSIMYESLSNKDSLKYIGNKGLGFRSIVNWAESVAIHSCGLKIEFSRDNTIRELAKEGVGSNNGNVPVLGIPVVAPSTDPRVTKDKGCLLEIKLKEDILPKLEVQQTKAEPETQQTENIEVQLKQINGLELLFLRHIKRIELNGKCFTKELCGNEGGLEKIKINDEVWFIKGKEGETPFRNQNNEIQKYSVKIAVPEKLPEHPRYHFFNYLATKIELELPFIIHATVEVSSERNQILDGPSEAPKNKWILDRVTEVVKEYVEYEIGKKEGMSDWNAYRMVAPLRDCDNRIVRETIYSKLKEFTETLKVYPLVNGSYGNKNDFHYINNPDSAFWSKLGQEIGFDKLGDYCAHFLKEVHINYITRFNRSITSYLYTDGIETLSKTISNIPDSVQIRADLITRLLLQYFEEERESVTHALCRQIPLLTNDANQLIDITADLYTPKSENTADFKLPSYITNLEFLNKELYAKIKHSLEFHSMLKEAFIRERNRVNGLTDRARANILGKITKIDEYDKNAVEKLIVRETNKLIDKTDISKENKINYIKEMVTFFKDIKLDANLENVKLLDENDNTCDAKELFFSSEINKDVLGSNCRFIHKKSYWNIQDEDEFRELMMFLGVNQFFISHEINGNCAPIIEPFFHYWTRDVVKTNFNVLNILKASTESQPKSTIEVLKKSVSTALSNLKTRNDSLTILALFLKENDLIEKIKETYSGTFKYQSVKEFSTKYNPLRCELLTAFKGKILDDFFIENIDKNRLEAAGIDEEQRNELFELLSTEVKSASSHDLAAIINSQRTINPEGKKIQSLYKLIVETLSDRDADNHITTSPLYLWSSDIDGKKEFHTSKNVYYSDNDSIPKAILKNLSRFRLDYPSRAGAPKVCSALGLQRLDLQNITILEESGKLKSCPFNDDFQKYFESLKPYILLLSTQNVNDPSDNISKIRNCSINLVQSCTFKYRDANEFTLNIGEVGLANGTYYLCVGQTESLEEMKNSLDFCQAFAEIVSRAQDLKPKDDFIHLFQNFEFAKQKLEKEFTPDEIAQSESYFGISSFEKKFWEKVKELNGNNFNFNDADKLYKEIYDEYLLSKDDIQCIKANNWSNEEDGKHLQKVFDTLKLNAEETEELLQVLNLSHYHKCRFENLRDDYRTGICGKIWESLKDSPEKHKNYIQCVNKIKQVGLDYDAYNHVLDVDYFNELNTKLNETFGITLDASDRDREPIEIRYSSDIISEHDAKELSNEQKSLLYFEGHDEEIRAFIKELHKDEGDEDKDDDDIDDEEISLETVTPGNIEADPEAANKDAAHRGGGTHKKGDDKKNARAGKKAEAKVNRYLKKHTDEYNSVDWVSSNSTGAHAGQDDSLGYDFTYKKTGSPTLRYLEVKSSSTGTKFILSDNEKTFAEGHKDHYDIAIVQGKKITIYEAFFSDENLITQNPLDWKVSFIKKND